MCQRARLYLLLHLRSVYNISLQERKVVRSRRALSCRSVSVFEKYLFQRRQQKKLLTFDSFREPSYRVKSSTKLVSVYNISESSLALVDTNPTVCYYKIARLWSTIYNRVLQLREVYDVFFFNVFEILLVVLQIKVWFI